MLQSPHLHWQAELASVANRRPNELNVWQQAYHRNMIGAKATSLATTFPMTREAIACDAFKAVVNAYIQQSDDHSENLNLYGQHFPSFIEKYCDDHALSPNIAELSTFERNVQAANYLPAGETDFDALNNVQPDQVERVGIVVNPTLGVARTSLNLHHIQEGLFDDTDLGAPHFYAALCRGSVIAIDELSDKDAERLLALLDGGNLAQFTEKFEGADEFIALGIQKAWIIGARID